MNWRLIVVGLLGSMAFASDHVRVILDTSISMQKKDEPRLAALSAALLFDLASPNLSQDDTFEVLGFDLSWPLRMWTSGPPPVQSGPRFRPRHNARTAFLEELRKIPYNAKNTYYYPVLKLAIEDLVKTPGGTADRRVIVLVTDGLPEDPDVSLIQRDLVSQLGPANIRLYILAFGSEAAKKSSTLHEILGGKNVGELFVDPSGDDLLSNMIKIFSRSFGYTAEGPLTASGAQPLNLEGGQQPERVAVVSFWKNPKAPKLRLSPPPSVPLNTDRSGSAEELGASYSASWLLQPRPGLYMAEPDPPGAAVAILRPARLAIDIRSKNIGGQTHSTIAQVQFPLRIMVSPPGGAKGDPGLFDFAFQTHGPRSGTTYAWDGRSEGSPAPGVVTAEGRYFDIFPTFSGDRETGREFYEGYLTIETKRGEAGIGAAAHKILVYPFVQLTPTPPVVTGAVGRDARAIAPREVACAEFHLSLDGSLPHPNRPVYPLRVTVDSSLLKDPRLNRARFTLDKIALTFDGAAGANPGDWYNGRSLSKEDLLRTHEVCLQSGRPRDADPGKPLEIKIQFSLMEAPYDDLPVIVPLALKVAFIPAGFLSEHGIFLALAATVIAIALLAWRSARLGLPSGLELVSGRDGGSDVLAPSTLQPAAPVPHYLGLSREYRAAAENGTVTLGTVEPLDRELFRFVPAPGVRLVDEPGKRPSVTEILSVRRTYIAACQHAKYRFRLEYR